MQFVSEGEVYTLHLCCLLTDIDKHKRHRWSNVPLRAKSFKYHACSKLFGYVKQKGILFKNWNLISINLLCYLYNCPRDTKLNKTLKMLNAWIIFIIAYIRLWKYLMGFWSLKNKNNNNKLIHFKVIEMTWIKTQPCIFKCCMQIYRTFSDVTPMLCLFENHTDGK